MSLRTHQRSNSESMQQRPALPDLDAKKSDNKVSVSDERYVYQRIDHRGLPRIPVDGKSPYETLKALNGALSSAPDSAAVYADHDRDGNCYVFLVPASDRAEDEKLNARYYRQELATVLGNLAAFIAEPATMSAAPASDMKNLRALASKTPESSSITVGELRKTIGNLQAHVQSHRTEHLLARHPPMDAVGLTLNRLKAFCAIARVEQQALCNDLRRHQTWLDTATANSMFDEAKSAAARIIAELEATKNLDINQLKKLPGFDKFAAFARLWKAFQDAGTDPENFRNPDDTYIAQLSNTSMAAFADWGKEIARLHSLISGEGGQRVDHKQSVRQEDSSRSLNEKLRAIAGKTPRNASSSHSLSYSGARSEITPRGALAESRRENQLKTLLFNHRLSSPRVKTRQSVSATDPLNEADEKKLEAYFSSIAPIKTDTGEETEVRDDPDNVQQTPPKPSSQRLWRRPVGTSERLSLDDTDSAGVLDTTNSSRSLAGSPPDNSPERMIQQFLQELYADIGSEADSEQPSRFVADRPSTNPTDPDWDPVVTKSLLSPGDSQWMDEEISRLTSPGRPLFEIDDDGQLSEFPVSPVRHQDIDPELQSGRQLTGEKQ